MSRVALTSLVAVVIAALNSGCTVGPDFQRPDARQAPGYLAAGEETRSVAAGGPTAILGDGPTRHWWTAFGSAELDTLVERAIANNYSLQASNATLAAARDRLRAVTGKQLPQVDASAKAQQQQINLAAMGFSSLGGVPIPNPEFHLYSVGGGVSYDLDLFGGVRRQVERSVAQVEARQRQTEAAHLVIAGQTVNQILTIAAIRAQIATAAALLQEDQRNIDLTEKRRRAGEGTLVEVLNARSQYTADRGELPQLGQQLIEARHQLATLVGVTPAELGATDFELARLSLPANIPVALPSELVHRRPDILQAEADVHAATAAIGVATARLYPDITIGASLTQAAPDVRDLTRNTFRAYDVFAGLTAPIFHGGTLRAERDAAINDARAAAATYQQTVIEAFGQVADLLAALDSDARSVANQTESVQVAQRSLHLSRRSFEVGNSSLLQVLDSERLHQRARYALVQAQTRQYLNVARLYVATAGNWSVPAVSAAE